MFHKNKKKNFNSSQSNVSNEVINPQIVKRASIAIFALFFTNGVIVNSWYARLPSVRDAMNLSALQLSQILIIAACGSVFGLPLVGYLNEKIGAKIMIVISIFAFAIVMITGLYCMSQNNIILLSLFLFLAQFVVSFCEGAMNIEGGRVEIAAQKNILSTYHGGFSLGTVVSSCLASFVSHMGINIYYHLISIYIVACSSIAIIGHFIMPHRYLRTVFFSKTNKAVTENKISEKKPKELFEDGEKNNINEQETNKKFNPWLEKRTLLIGVTILGSALAEGAANDWLSLSLVESFSQTEAFGALALGIFVAMMTATRIFGSFFVEKYGRVRVLRICTFIGGVGLFVFVFSPWIQLCMVAIVAWGIGSALGFPLGMSASSDDPAKAPMRVAVTSTIAYGAFFIGPAVVGFLAEYLGYRLALSIIILPIIIALIYIPVLKPLPSRMIINDERSDI